MRVEGQTNPLGQVTNPQSPNPLGQASESPGLSSTPATANAVTIEANQVYAAGTQLYSPWTGLSFRVPEGFVAAFDAAEGVMFVAAQDQSQVLIVEAASSATAAQLGGAVLEEIVASLEPENPAFVVAGPTEQGDTLAISYNVDGYTLRASARQGAAGNAAVVAGYALQTEALTQTVDALSASFSFSDPQVSAANSQLGGTDFFSNAADSFYSPGGVGDGSFASGTERRYSFCSDGRYAHEYSSKTFFSVEGVGGSSSEESDAHQGRWTLSQTLMGSHAVLLESSDGRAFVQTLEQVAEGVVLDGFLYQVSSSQQCN